MSATGPPNMLALRNTPEEVDHEMVEALMPMSVTTRAEVATQLLLSIPNIATQLYNHTEEVRSEAKQLTNFLFVATDEAITDVRNKIAQNQISSREAIQELYIRCAGQFGLQESAIHATAENQAALTRIVEQAQLEANKATELGSLAAESVYKIASSLAGVESTVYKLVATVQANSSESAGQSAKREAETRKVAQELVEHKNQFNNLFNQCVNMHNIQQETVNSVKSIESDINKWKAASNAADTKIADLQKCLAQIKSIPHVSETTLQSLQAEIATATRSREVLEGRIAKGGSISRALENTEDRLGRMERKLCEVEADLAARKQLCERLAGENAALQMRLAVVEARLESVERRSPDAIPPHDPTLMSQVLQATAAPSHTEEQLRTLRDELETLRQSVRVMSETRAATDPSDAAALTANKIKNAHAIAVARGFVNSSDPDVTPIFAVMTDEIAAFPEPYCFPNSMLKEMSPLIIAVAEKCRINIDSNRAAVRARVASIVGNKKMDYTREYLTAMENGTNQQVSELLVALDRGVTEARRFQFSGWLSRARQNGVFQSDAETWKKQAIGADGYGIPLSASSSETTRLVPPLNF